VTSELAGKTAELSARETALSECQRVVENLSAELEVSRAEAASREAAFNQLFEREHEREVAELANHAAAANGGDMSDSGDDQPSSRVAALEGIIERLQASVTAAEERVANERQALAEKMRGLTQREAQLHELERRVQENQQRVAAEAQRVASSNGTTGDRRHRAMMSDGSGDDGSGGASSSWRLKVDPFVSQLRAGRLLVQTQSAHIASRARRFWPLVIVAALLVVLLSFGGSASVGSSGTATTTALNDALSQLQKRYSTTVDQLIACESAAAGKTGAGKDVGDAKAPPA
jgi:hypothetical protein